MHGIHVTRGHGDANGRRGLGETASENDLRPFYARVTAASTEQASISAPVGPLGHVHAAGAAFELASKRRNDTVEDT